MRIFLDTEFSERGPAYPVVLISLALVAEDGRELYMVHSGFTPEDCNPWVRENVLPNLGDGPRFSLEQIRERIIAFVGNETPTFIGYFADYDWVVFCQIFGAMVNLPEHYPMFCLDLKQMAVELGNPKLPEQESTEHNALNDARWNRDAYTFLTKYTGKLRIVGENSGAGMITYERLRQISQEGWTPEHDDEHIYGELAFAGSVYAATGGLVVCREELPEYRGADVQAEDEYVKRGWPFDVEWLKHSGAPIRNLVKAGALIAAEIDRLLRQRDRYNEASALAAHQKEAAIEELKKQPVSDHEKLERCDWCGMEMPKGGNGGSKICDDCCPFL